MFESFKFECMSLNDILPYTRLALIKFKELFPSAPILIVSDYDYKWGLVGMSSLDHDYTINRRFFFSVFSNYIPISKITD